MIPWWLRAGSMEYFAILTFDGSAFRCVLVVHVTPYLAFPATRQAIKETLYATGIELMASTSNADRWICDFYDTTGSRQRSSTSGTGGSNASAGVADLKK